MVARYRDRADPGGRNPSTSSLRELGTPDPLLAKIVRPSSRPAPLLVGANNLSPRVTVIDRRSPSHRARSGHGLAAWLRPMALRRWPGVLCRAWPVQMSQRRRRAHWGRDHPLLGAMGQFGRAGISGWLAGGSWVGFLVLGLLLLLWAAFAALAAYQHQWINLIGYTLVALIFLAVPTGAIKWLGRVLRGRTPPDPPSRLV
jgi:hypothetical protein